MLLKENPILKGFYPDPSVCRVGEDYYLVNSSFSYFPGVPVFHSRDLAHWEQVGNILERPGQIRLEGGEISRGIFAPVLRWHNGIFYMITTNIDQGGNFIMTSKTPEGPWSNPYYLENEAEGIDPSLFFDDDGTCYYVGTRPNKAGVKYNGDWEIWIQELNVEKMQLVGESRKIWKGAMNHAVWPEGPHLYKTGGYYYLIHAEGGTGMEHSITAARSRSLKDNFEGCPANPIFTHRHLGRNYPVTCAGHGDLFDDGKGNWYMVMLATRMCKGCSSMGRETFLAKVEWEEGWPVINPGIGKLEDRVELPGEACRFPKEETEDDIIHFHRDDLEPSLISIYGRDETMYSLKEHPGCLRLFANKAHPGEKKRFSYIGVRQKGYRFEASTGMEFNPDTEGAGAGFLLYQNHENYLKAEVRKEKQERYFYVIQNIKGEETILSREPIENEMTEIIVRAEEQNAAVFTQVNGKRKQAVSNIDLRPYTTEYAGGFVVCTMGVFASSYGKEEKDYADFSWISVINH